MRTWCSPRLAAVIALASLLAGCGAGGDAGKPSARPWQLRLVTSSSTEPCSAPPLTSADPSDAQGRGVEAPITTGPVTIAVGTAGGAEQLVAALVAAAPGATATP